MSEIDRRAERPLSPTRLVEFLGCEHRVALWLAGETPSDGEDETQVLFRTKGLEHEAAVLARLQRATGQAAVRIPTEGASLEERLRLTQEAIRAGSQIIYQGALSAGRWIGFPDFLVLSENAGKARYRPEDAKLSRTAKRDHLLQLAIYAELIKRANGTCITDGVIHVSAGEPERFDLRETEFIGARLMRRLEDFAALPKKTRPLRCPACAKCAYRTRCETEWRQSDSPIFVAGLRTGQLLRLEAAGVHTMSELAEIGSGIRIKGIGAETLPKLSAQARLQKIAQETGKHCAEVLPVVANRGFSLLPPPNRGDLFLDLEGDPFGPLEYLFGLFGRLDGNTEPSYRSYWAHTQDEEREAFEGVVRAITAHLAASPDAHVFHFAAYEITALKRLAMKFGTMEAELDDLLRTHRFVDLYRIVKHAIRASTETYGLKDLEKIFWGGRTGQVANAGASMVEYEKWRVTGDASILADIANYNREDCVATAMLRDWLEELRPRNSHYAPPASVPDEEPAGLRSAEREAGEQELRQLATRVRAVPIADEKTRELVAELLWFHGRAHKPQWWAIFERQAWSNDELIEDAESLGAITLDDSVPVETVKRSSLITCKFPPQDTKLRIGTRPVFPDALIPVGTVASIRPEEGVLVVKRGIGLGDLPSAFSLLPPKPVNQRVLSDAVKSFAQRFASERLDQDQALLDVLLRRPPRIRNHQPDTDLLLPEEGLLSGTIRTIQQMDHTALFIQGPPGCGKTLTAARSVVHLLKNGKRVGVSSNSHKAINLLLEKIEEAATGDGFAFNGVKKASPQDDDSHFDGSFVSSVEASGEVGPEHELVGGTAFHFAQEELSSYDYLFVDEAGQVALGNLVAMAGCAKNIVLIGDQMQLAQPVQGVHPGETGLSCLAYLLQHQATIAPDRGILLNVSYRMHPRLCEFVSQALYDGRLASAPCAAERSLVLDGDPHPALQPAGMSFCIVQHEGCTQNSFEEARVISALVSNLVRQRVRGEEGCTRQLSLNDILIVSPFNMQVNTLRQTLPEGTRVGTVDKFQGQEAPVVIVSMATSHGDDAPRGTEFLFSRNRFNVAVSRAQCLAIVVQSPRLLDVSAGSIEDLVRLNLFARAEAGGKIVRI